LLNRSNGITGTPEYLEVLEVNWLDVDTRTEKARFGMSVASLIFIYVIPQMGGFYFFARLFAR
jgi:hypothetical protein